MIASANYMATARSRQRSARFRTDSRCRGSRPLSGSLRKTENSRAGLSAAPRLWHCGSCPINMVSDARRNRCRQRPRLLNVLRGPGPGHVCACNSAALRRAYGAAVRVKRERFSTVTNRRTLTFDVLESRRLLAVDASLSAAVAPDAEGEDLSSEAPQASNSYQVIRSFGGGSDNGATPAASLTLVGTTIYGTTEGGGSSAFGTLFSMNQDGSNFQVLHSFAGGGIDGAYPSAGVVLVGSVLYGTTSAGGTANNGTVFSIDTDGSNYQIMHSFAANASDGSSPLSDLTVIGPTLYGTTQLGGGTHSAGTIFSINADGSNFQVLHSFSFPDGQEPDAGLTLVGSTLYGTTHSGGSRNDGTLFSVSVDGSSFHVLHSFSGPDGSNPASALTVVGSALYGTAESGAVFSISTTGSNYHVLHSFSIGPGGQDPHAGLTLVGSTLYGATVLGGSAGKGTVFSINPDGSNFQVQHSFTDADAPRRTRV